MGGVGWFMAAPQEQSSRSSSVFVCLLSDRSDSIYRFVRSYVKENNSDHLKATGSIMKKKEKIFPSEWEVPPRSFTPQHASAG